MKYNWLPLTWTGFDKDYWFLVNGPSQFNHRSISGEHNYNNTWKNISPFAGIFFSVNLTHHHRSITRCMSGKFLHWNGQGAQACSTTKSNCDYKRGLDSKHICLQNPRKNIRWEDVLKFRGACNEYQAGIHTWSGLGYGCEQSINEGRLCRWSAECAT